MRFVCVPFERTSIDLISWNENMLSSEKRARALIYHSGEINQSLVFSRIVHCGVYSHVMQYDKTGRGWKILGANYAHFSLTVLHRNWIWPGARAALNACAALRTLASATRKRSRFSIHHRFHDVPCKNTCIIVHNGAINHVTLKKRS